MFDSESAEVTFEPSGKTQSWIRLASAAPDAPVDLRLRAEEENPRRLRAPVVEVAFRAGAPEEAHASGGGARRAVACGQIRR
jgi:hypothetical protein